MKKPYALDVIKKRRWPKVLLIAGIVALIFMISTVLVIRRTYEQNLRPISNSQEIREVTVPLGASVKEIAQILHDSKLIKSAWAFEWYVRNNNAREALQAGVYPLRANQSVEEIVSILTNGKVSTDLVTILPGKRIDQIKQTLINNGYEESDIDNALNPATFTGHPALVDKPADASLEGYIYPESFLKTSNTKPEEIIRGSLDEMQKFLTPDLRANIARQGLSVHEAITLASIIEQESGNEADKKTIAQVFLKRLRDGMRLESDATASYGAALSGELENLSESQSLQYDSLYNTYQTDGLPPGPISNFNISSLEAVANPSTTDFLYFVADDEGVDKGKSFFSRTLQEHQVNIAEHCKILCQ